MKDGLTLRDNAKADLIDIRSIESGVTYLNKLESVAIWVMKEKKDAELSNLVAEQKLRTQRILGELLKQSEKGQGMRTDLLPAGKEVKNKETVSDMGLSHKQSSTFQQIAEIPERDFEKFIEDKKSAVNNAVKELTTTGAMKLAKSLKQKKDVSRERDINARLDMERELRDLAGDLKKKYNREQIEKLIKFLTK